MEAVPHREELNGLHLDVTATGRVGGDAQQAHLRLINTETLIAPECRFPNDSRGSVQEHQLRWSNLWVLAGQGPPDSRLNWEL